jgi:hypothetical protein
MRAQSRNVTRYWNAGGAVANYNTALVGGSPLFDGVIGAAARAFDPTDTHLPRVDAYAPANKACTTNSNTTVDSLPDTTGLFVGMGVQGVNIPAGVTITAVNIPCFFRTSSTIISSFTVISSPLGLWPGPR